MPSALDDTTTAVLFDYLFDLNISVEAVGGA
jgi:hypothetical protein